MVTIPAVLATAFLTTVLAPLWIPVVVLVDLVLLRRRLPLTRLTVFGWWWSVIESVGVVAAGALFVSGRSRRAADHYRLMAWWSNALMRGLDVIGGIRVEVEGVEELRGGPAIVVSRHASFADSLVSGWVTSAVAGLWPRYVLKRELLIDPCLDVVGNRVPNHFLDRAAVDGAAELDALRALVADLDDGDVAVIFAEGTRANPRKRRRALDKIALVDPERARRLEPLRHLLPPRPAGTVALLEGAPAADVVLVWHIGFDGFDTIGGMLRRLGRPRVPARFVARRVPRAEVGDDPATWLDRVWVDLDDEVDRALAAVDRS